MGLDYRVPRISRMRLQPITSWRGCWWLILWGVWALCAQTHAQPPSDVARLSEQRDKHCSRLTFIWHMELRLLYKNGVIKHSSATINIARWNTLTHIIHTPESTEIPPETLSSWFAYYGDGWGIRCKPLFLKSAGRVYSKWTALVYPCPSNCLYYEATVFREMYEPHPIELVILAGADFTRVMGASWTALYRDNDTQVLEGVYRLPPFNEDAVLRIRVLSKNGSPVAIERYSSKTPYKVTWHVVHYKQVAGILCPAKVQAVWQTRPDEQVLPNKRAVFELVSVKRTPGPIPIRIPQGTPVQDFRTLAYWDILNVLGVRINNEEFVHYTWQGQIPDKSLLRALAWQQGKLPGKGVGIRATWVLFIPGVLLLALAIYWYRRIRRAM